VLIEWSESLCLGLGEVDAQHREMAELLNRLQGAASGSDPGPALGILDELYLHTRDHFGFEERLMAENAYPGAVEHRREHLMLMAELKSFIAGVRRGGEQLDAAALAGLKKWLVGHIIANDRALVEYLQQAWPEP
jgi:hemerythrin-like metal-binding protein